MNKRYTATLNALWLANHAILEQPLKSSTTAVRLEISRDVRHSNRANQNHNTQFDDEVRLLRLPHFRFPLYSSTLAHLLQTTSLQLVLLQIPEHELKVQQKQVNEVNNRGKLSYLWYCSSAS